MAASAEILPGVVHWTARHANLGQEVSSYWLREEGVLLNPLEPPEDLGFEARPPGDVVLTNRHHVRDGERFGARIHVPAPGLHELEGSPAEVVGYDDGDELPGGLVAQQVGGLSADEFALHLPAHDAVAFADGLIRIGDGPLQFVPDGLMGDDPAQVKRDLAAAFEALLDAWAFDHLLLAHGDPWLHDGREALARFVRGATG